MLPSPKNALQENLPQIPSPTEPWEDLAKTAGGMENLGEARSKRRSLPQVFN